MDQLRTSYSEDVRGKIETIHSWEELAKRLKTCQSIDQTQRNTGYDYTSANFGAVIET